MAKQFHELPTATTADGTEYLAIQQQGVLKKIVSAFFAKAAEVVKSINGKTPSGGAVTLDYTDIGSDPAGTAQDLIEAHQASFSHGDITHSNRSILDQINQALVDLAPSSGTWTPFDASGNGGPLAFTGVSNCNWWKIGKAVFITGELTYPTNSDAVNTAAVGGLPFEPAFLMPVVPNFNSGYSTSAWLQVHPGKVIKFYNTPGYINPKTNSVCSGVAYKFNFYYMTA